MTTEDKRQATLKRLHEVVATTQHSYTLADAVMRMAIRYGAAAAFDPADRSIDWRLARRAETRRFEALGRLVTALERGHVREVSMAAGARKSSGISDSACCGRIWNGSVS